MSTAVAVVGEAPGAGEVDCDREYVARFGLKGFVEIAWSQLEPGPFIDGWHIDEICAHLEAVTDGRIRNLIVNQPPATMKSTLVCVMWPLWVWINNPSRRWIFATHSDDLRIRDARKMRNILESQWWRERWPDVWIPQTESRAIGVFDNNHRGFRLSTTTGGRVMGRHAHFEVVDDPHKPMDFVKGVVPSRSEMSEIYTWWSGTMATRRADPAFFGRVVVMQRLHDLDLCGSVLEEMRQNPRAEQYEVLRLPMRYEAANPCRTSIGGDRRTVDGELLWQRYTEDQVVDLEASLVTERNRAAQLQQRPVPAAGNIIKHAWLRHWGQPGSAYPELPAEVEHVMTWDFRFKDDPLTGSFVVGQVWAIYRMSTMFLVDQVRGRWGFSESLHEIEKMAAKWPKAYRKLIENKANGAAIASVLRHKFAGIELVDPEGTKEERLQACEPLFEGGNVYLPPDTTAYPWVPDYIHELTTFPAAAQDDQVDATSQLLKEYAKGSTLERVIAFTAAMRKVAPKK